MKLKIIFFFFMSFKISIAQNFIVLDSKTKDRIPYAAIQFPETKFGFYTSDMGNFSLQNIKKSDNIVISSLGYFTLRTAIKKLKDSIFLTPSTSKLDEVIILSKPKSYKKIGFIKKSNSGWFGTQGLQLGILVKVEQKYIGNYIDKIIIPFRKKMHGIKEYNYKSVFKLSVFSVKDNKPDVSLLETPIMIKLNNLSDELIEINVSNEYIKLKDTGFFLCIEQIGELNKKNIVISKNRFLPGLGFSSKKPKGFKYFNSFYRDKNIENWSHLSDIMEIENKLYLGIQLVLGKL